MKLSRRNISSLLESLPDPKDTFKFQDLKISYNLNPPQIQSPTTFGTLHTAHMLTIKHKYGEWQKPIIHPFQNLEVHPFASGLNYAVQCYEGLKAYSTQKGTLLFRPQLNMNRFRHSNKRLALPDFCGNEFLKCIEELIRIDKDYVPKNEQQSLYIRPFSFADNQSLGVRKGDEHVVHVVLSPVSAYYSQGFKPSSLFIEENKTRCYPGGSGRYKLGSNYGPTVSIQMETAKKGFTQTLWTWDDEILEVGTRPDGPEILTPDASDMVLEGITRQSIIQLLEKRGIPVHQRRITIDELTKKLEQNEVLEVFATGTAVTIGSVDRIGRHDKVWDIPVDQATGAGKLTYEIYEELRNIQYGRVDHEWQHVIN